MTDLYRLSPPALGAAMKTGTDGWGRHGSVADHALYIQAVPKRRNGWRLCRCGCRKRETHAVMANGVAMALGCELHARRWKREVEQSR